MPELFVYVHDLRSSGVVRNAIRYARRLAQDRPTTLVAGHGGGLFAGEARAAGCAFVALADRPVSRPTAALLLRRWLRARPPGILLSAGNLGHPSAYWATRGLAGRRLYRISNVVDRGDGWRGVLRRRWMAMLVRDAARVVLVGRGMRTLPLLDRAVAEGRAMEVDNGVDRAHALARAAAPCPHSWLDDHVPVVVAVGRLRPQKNLTVLVAAVGVARRTRRLRLVLIGAGTGEVRTQLKALAAAANLGDDFLLAGETDNVFAWVARATVFALPSRWEGSSMALLEALAVGTPVVASVQAGDAAHVLADGAHGLLVDADDVEGLAAALLRQCSSAAVRPGDRADDFAESVERYARLVAEVAGD